MAEVIAGLRWYLEIDGITEHVFTEVTGFETENEVIDHRTTGKSGNLVQQKIPGALKYSNVVARRGLTDDMKLWNWRQQVVNGQIQASRKSGTLTCYSPEMTPIAIYQFTNGWPAIYKGPDANSTQNEIATEEITIAVETMTRTQ